MKFPTYLNRRVFVMYLAELLKISWNIFMSASRLTWVHLVVFFCSNITLGFPNVSTRCFCWVFASLNALPVIYLLPVKLEDLHTDRKNICFYHYECWGQVLGSRKANLNPRRPSPRRPSPSAPSLRSIHYWPFQCGTFIVILFFLSLVILCFIF